MKKIIYLVVWLCFAFHFQTLAQCSVNFGSNAAILNFSTFSGDIVHAVFGETHYMDSFDVWQDDSFTVVNCASNGGMPDFSVELTILPTFDVYGGKVIDTLAGVRHDIVQSTSGLRGSLPFNNSGTNESSTGDVRAYTIKVKFAKHVNLKASNFSVNVSSVNTDASVFESCVVEFLDSAGHPFAPATYQGYYDNSAPSRINTLCPAGFLDSAGFIIRAQPWIWSGSGTYASQSVTTVDIDDVCNPINGIKGTNDDKQVNPVNDAGLNQNDRIGGFIFKVYAEDVAGSPSDSGVSASKTSSNTLITSTLNGFTIPGALPVTWLEFDVVESKSAVKLNWKTSSEINNSHFEIERYGQEEGFTKIGEVKGAGNSNDIQSYEFTDLAAKPGELNYYRLKQVDFNGSFEYSEVRSIQSELLERTCTYPNPVHSDFSLYVAKSARIIFITDEFGRMMEHMGSLKAGCTKVFRCDKWLNQIYFVHILYEDLTSEVLPILKTF